MNVFERKKVRRGMFERCNDWNAIIAEQKEKVQFMIYSFDNIITQRMFGTSWATIDNSDISAFHRNVRKNLFCFSSFYTLPINIAINILHCKLYRWAGPIFFKYWYIQLHPPSDDSVERSIMWPKETNTRGT